MERFPRPGSTAAMATLALVALPGAARASYHSGGASELFDTIFRWLIGGALFAGMGLLVLMVAVLVGLAATKLRAPAPEDEVGFEGGVAAPPARTGTLALALGAGVSVAIGLMAALVAWSLFR